MLHCTAKINEEIALGTSVTADDEIHGLMSATKRETGRQRMKKRVEGSAPFLKKGLDRLSHG